MSLHTIVLLSYITGLVSCLIGAFSTFILKAKSMNICFALEFSSGVMLSVLFCEALPYAFEKGSFLSAIVSLISGISLLALVQETSMKNPVPNGGVIAVNFCVRNFSEGVLLGTGFFFSSDLGMHLLLSILVRNTPEIIAFALSLKKNGTRKAVIFIVCVLIGLFFGAGTHTGCMLGRVDTGVMSIVFAFCSGMMLYTALGDNLPRSHRLYNGRRTEVFCIAGVLVGLFMINLS